jgi:GDPmannose 4,6-dehydratase
LQEKLYLGNLDAKRDWGHARDYVDAMWLMLQQERPDDYVIATGTTTAVRDFIKMAFSEVGIEIEFKGKGVDETGFVKRASDAQYSFSPGQEIVAVDPRYFRPTEVEILMGDPSKAKRELGWEPRYDLSSLVHEMVEADLQLFQREKVLKEAGFSVKNYFE